MPRTIEISHRTIIFTVIVLGAIWLVIQISSIILALFVAILLTTALNPLVDFLAKLKVPRILAVVLIYLTLIAFLGWGLAGILPPLVDQTTNLVNRFPLILTQFSYWINSIGIKEITPETLSSQVSQFAAIPASIVSLLVSFFSNLFSVLTVLVITFYMLLEREKLNRYLVALFGEGREKEAKLFVTRLETRLGGWVRGELILMTIIGLLTYIGLVLLSIPYALPLAILAGILELVPGIGPIISSIPAILLGLTISPIMALAVAALYFLIQQFENNLIVPNVMQRVAGVNPLVTMISIAVGFKLAGVIGAVLGVPIVIVLQVVASEFVFGK